MKSINNINDVIKNKVAGEEMRPLKNIEKKLGGQNKCPQCGSTDIDTQKKLGVLTCNNCRYEFEEEIYQEINKKIKGLVGEKISNGLKNIDCDASDTITLKCESCGAEVFIDTSDSAHARCHWCRSNLTIDTQIPNGTIPDAILPFGVGKAEAKSLIENFVGQRKFFAHPQFTKEFTTENIMGVYFPYMSIDMNAHATFRGHGEKLIRKYRVKVGKNRSETRYDADRYEVYRDFDIRINDTTIESNEARLDNDSSSITNNIINSIMPFDVHNCVYWNANYLKGYSSEKRDVNIEQVKNTIETQALDIVRHKIKSTTRFYDRGIAWKEEDFEVIGQRWHAVYLPVWLYSYQQKRSVGYSTLHYVAVNGRTKENMGSVPINYGKLILISVFIEIIALYIVSKLFPYLLLVLDSDDSEAAYAVLLLIFAGPIFYFAQYKRYRNGNARHFHEKDTKSELGMVIDGDKLIRRYRGLRNSQIRGRNDNRVDSQVNK